MDLKHDNEPGCFIYNMSQAKTWMLFVLNNKMY